MTNQYKGSKKFHGRSVDLVTESTGNGNDLSMQDYTDVVLANTNDSTLTVTLPEGAERDGNIVCVIDIGGNAGTNAITVTSSGSSVNVNGSDQNLTIATNYAKMELVFVSGSGWFATTSAP